MFDVGKNCCGNHSERPLLKKLNTYQLPFAIGLVWLFHVSAIVGCVLGHADWFIALTPLNLALSAALVLVLLKNDSRIALLIPFLIGFGAEWLGVNKGWIFGDYSYGENLGWKWMGVPWMIGVNWALLVFATHAIASRFTKSEWGIAIVGSSLMVLLDALMEQCAPAMNYWQFAGGIVPLQNYVGWFCTSMAGHLLHARFTRERGHALGIHLYFAFAFFFFTYWFIVL
jgi:putative membrane protein